MDEEAIPVRGTVLLIDAAGPESIIGLVNGREWISCQTSSQDFLEFLDKSVVTVMREGQLDFNDLAGIYYASGPGSTLGLRLAALFVRTLLQVPELNGLSCYQYQNLEAAISGSPTTPAAVAPWRRDRLHLCEKTVDSGAFHNSGISPRTAVENKIPGFILGRRMPPADLPIGWQPFPAGRLPEILHQHPGLLRKTSSPRPYAAEAPEFAKWNPQRHSAK